MIRIRWKLPKPTSLLPGLYNGYYGQLGRTRCCKSVHSSLWAMAFVGEGGSVTLDVSNDIMRRQINMLGSWTFSRSGQDDCTRFVVKHNLPVDNIITHKFKIEDAEVTHKLFDQQQMGRA
jgi:hypothetical protein